MSLQCKMIEDRLSGRKNPPPTGSHDKNMTNHEDLCPALFANDGRVDLNRGHLDYRYGGSCFHLEERSPLVYIVFLMGDIRSFVVVTSDNGKMINVAGSAFGWRQSEKKLVFLLVFRAAHFQSAKRGTLSIAHINV